jgi:hypothetical protein
LRFLLPYLDRPSLAQTAGASITELGRHKELRDPNKAEFIPALQQVLKTDKDATVQEQAGRYLRAANEGWPHVDPGLGPESVQTRERLPS